MDEGRDEADKKISEGAGELFEGWKSYYEKKEEGSEKISSGWNEYNDNEEKATNQLSEQKLISKQWV